MGFSRLKRDELPKSHEPVISGMICEGIAKVLDDRASPRWVDDYEIHDDPPVHHESRKGKHRRRVDIKLASRRTRPRLRFGFEAKVLNPKAGVADYLGKDGLGLFVAGEYSASEGFAGMLAYVQSDDCDAWCTKLSAKLDKKTHKLGHGGQWKVVQIASELTHTFQTIHKRPKLKNIRVVHTLLDCTGTTG